MADRLVRISSSCDSISARRHPGPDGARLDLMLPALLRGILFIAAIAAPFLTALLTG